MNTATPGPNTAPTRRRHRRWPWVLVLALFVSGAYRFLQEPTRAAPTSSAKPSAPAVPVVVATARQGDMPVYLTGLGSVTAFNTVTVKSRVDGQLIKVAFQEGQLVRQGDLLAEIDPRPFEVQLTQAEGQLARDVALLKEAKRNLQRYRELVTRELIATQLVDEQVSTVGQYEGAVKVDQGAIDNAKLQLIYCRITAPISGRVGLRLVDVGNMIHVADSTGLVVITQVEPITVRFTITEDQLQPVLKKLEAGERLPVDAYDRAGQTKIATGYLLTSDNQIDPSTGTTRLKAVFENRDHALFPNQFVNARVLLDVRPDAVIVPTAAIQRGPQGTFVYLVRTDQTVEVRPVTVGPMAGTDSAITAGLAPGDVVVTEGVDKLRAGMTVEARTPEAESGGPGAEPSSAGVPAPRA